ncbi:MAG: 50S ribosomal protein L11 methyltransferase [Acidobacteria bacterium]|nr:50S ribosomal protein L11 methyltransferase [Acidobacteriota bacterium]
MKLFICPSRAFGTGEHPTTRMCLEEIERCGPRGLSVLDAGTGSGILAIAAKLLGAADVVGVDNDPEAIEVAVKNARLNGAAGAIRFVIGDTASIDDRRFDLVVANLNGTILARAIPDLASRLAAGGALVLSGILPEEVGEITAVAAAAGLAVERAAARDGWACLVCGARRA